MRQFIANIKFLTNSHEITTKLIKKVNNEISKGEIQPTRLQFLK